MNLDEVRASIKHPHFYYAVIDVKAETVVYKRKKWYKWFSGKRIVTIKIAPFEVPAVTSYEEDE